MGDKQICPSDKLLSLFILLYFSCLTYIFKVLLLGENSFSVIKLWQKTVSLSFGSQSQTRRDDELCIYFSEVF